MSEIISAVFYGRPKTLLKSNEGLLSCFLGRKKKGFYNKLPPFAVLVLSLVLFVSLICLLIISALLCLPSFNLTF